MCLKKGTYIVNKLVQGKKTYVTRLIVSYDEFFTCFLLCSKIDEDVYDVEQNFRGT